MASKVVMPGQGQNDDPLTLVAWKYEEGDQVTKGDVLCEAERDKATLEVEAPDSGVLLKRLYGEDDTVPELATIGFIGQPGEQIEHAEQGAEASATGSAPPASDKDAYAASAAEPVKAASSSRPSGGQFSRRIRISPRARRLAEQEEVDVTTVIGSGSGGRIVVRDVEEALRTRGPAPDRSTTSIDRSGRSWTVAQPDQVIPVTGVRRTIANRMAESLATTAQLTLHKSANASPLLAYRKKLKASPEESGFSSVTINDLVMFAASRILPRFPRLNSHFLGDTIAEYASVNLGMAVDTERGLMVPVIRGADRLSLKELSIAAAELRQACVAGTVKPDEMSSGTFTVTNLGPLGVEFFTPVLNVPQVAILGVGSIQPRPVMIDDQVAFPPHIGLSLTVDHQAVDGAPAATFLREIVRGLEQIELLLAV